MYKLTKNSGDQTIIVKTDGDIIISFLVDPANTDYQAYLKWLEEGNIPIPADIPTTPTA